MTYDEFKAKTIGYTKLYGNNPDFAPSLPNYATEHMFQSTLPVWGATAKMHKILFLISEEYVDSAKRQAVGLNIKGNLPFIPSAF